jgi:steroid delta-isomerase-like uncharacterized protein
MDAESAVRQFYDAMNTGNTDLLDEVLADDWEDIPLPPETEKGRENFKQALAMLRATLANLTISTEDLFVSADGSRVAVRSTSRATHAGEMFGIPATGKEVSFRAFDIHAIENGLIVRSWHLEDLMALVGQLREESAAPQA